MPIDRGAKKAQAARVGMGAAIREAREARDPKVRQEDLATMIGLSDNSTVSRWENPREAAEPTLRQVLDVEHKLDLPKGWLFVRAGYVDCKQSVEMAIADVPGLSAQDRQFLLETYQVVRTRSRRARR